MTDQNGATEPTKESATKAAPNEPAKRIRERANRTKEVEERVPMTFSVSAGFAKRLKLVVSAVDESSGEYVETRLSQVVKRDLRRILEEME